MLFLLQLFSRRLANRKTERISLFFEWSMISKTVFPSYSEAVLGEPRAVLGNLPPKNAD